MATLLSSEDLRMGNKAAKLLRYTTGATSLAISLPMAYPEFVLLSNEVRSGGNARISGTAIKIENVGASDNITLLVIGA